MMESSEMLANLVVIKLATSGYGYFIALPSGPEIKCLEKFYTIL